MELKKHLGDLLVEAGIITPVTLTRALERQRINGARLGEILEDMGVITQEELMQSLARQFHFKRVTNIASHQFSTPLLSLIPVEIALMRLVFPLKHTGETLFLAMNDPFDQEIFDFLSEKKGIKVIPVLATRNDILEAIALHYKNQNMTVDQHHTLLVIDDDPRDTQLIELALQNEGYAIRSIHDSSKTVPTAVECHPDLILCDTIMPRQDGFDILNNLMADFRTREIPVIMLTSLASGEDEKKAMESGCIDFIPKPLKPMRIIARVKRALQCVECFQEKGIRY